MITIAPFVLDDLSCMDIHPHYRRTADLYLTPEYRESLLNGVSRTVRADGEIILCGGVLDLYADKSIGHLWSFLSCNASRHLLFLHRATRRFMQVSGKRTLVATSECTNGLGCRWIEMLGFVRDEPLPAYGPDGADHILYLRTL